MLCGLHLWAEESEKVKAGWYQSSAIYSSGIGCLQRISEAVLVYLSPRWEILILSPFPVSCHLDTSFGPPQIHGFFPKAWLCCKILKTQPEFSVNVYVWDQESWILSSLFMFKKVHDYAVTLPRECSIPTMDVLDIFSAVWNSYYSSHGGE